jgi:hypothetical protein
VPIDPDYNYKNDYYKDFEDNKEDVYRDTSI